MVYHLHETPPPVTPKRRVGCSDNTQKRGNFGQTQKSIFPPSTVFLPPTALCVTADTTCHFPPFPTSSILAPAEGWRCFRQHVHTRSALHDIPAGIPQVEFPHAREDESQQRELLKRLHTSFELGECVSQTTELDETANGEVAR